MTEDEKEYWRQKLIGWKIVNELKEGLRREEMCENLHQGLPNEITGYEWNGPLSIEIQELISSTPKRDA